MGNLATSPKTGGSICGSGRKKPAPWGEGNLFDPSNGKILQFDNITIPSYSTVSHEYLEKPYMVFHVKVKVGPGPQGSWVVYRRYSEFVELHRALASIYPDVPKLTAGRGWPWQSSLKREFIEQRLKPYLLTHFLGALTLTP